MAAIEERLRRGAVHLVKRNRTVAVVLTVVQLAELSQRNSGLALPRVTAIQWLLRQPAIGSKSRRQLKRELGGERKSWR